MKTQTYFEIAKSAVVIFLVAGLIFVGWQGYTWINNKMEVQQAQTEAALESARRYKEYQPNLARADTEIVNDLKEEINKLRDDWKEALEDIEEKNEEITNMGSTIARLEENIRKLGIESSHTYRAGTGDLNEQYFIDIMYPVKNKKGEVVKEIPYAWAIFYPNKPAGEKWKYGIYPLDYYSQIVQTEQQDGQYNTYTKVWFENNDRSMSKGYEVPIDIVESKYKQEEKTEEEMFWWAPHISLGLDGMFSSSFDGAVGGSLNISTSGYGKTKNDLTWKFFEFGVGMNNQDELYGKFSPFSYNIGRNLPLVENTFVGPYVGITDESDYVLGLGLTIPF